MLHIEPFGQMRPRATARGRFAQVYKDPKQRSEEAVFKEEASRFRPSEPWTGPLMLGIKAYLPIPRSKSKKWQRDAMAGLIRPTGKPDTSNIIKMAEDCMNEVFWIDDSQVVEYLPGTGKWYGEPRWEITICKL